MQYNNRMPHERQRPEADNNKQGSSVARKNLWKKPDEREKFARGMTKVVTVQTDVGL